MTALRQNNPDILQIRHANRVSKRRPSTEMRPVMKKASWRRTTRNPMFERIKLILSALSAAGTLSFVVALETGY
jgi:hypothetical protein